mmetsp:Transcript_20656/g.52602  ORF Transcript_20656/g.52602 Transcript_20656/m.52602 type:complete len:420 (-) Transcript_20656:327-1586(-)
MDRKGMGVGSNKSATRGKESKQDRDTQFMLSRMFGGDPDKNKDLGERFSVDLSKKYGEGGYGATFAAAAKDTGEHLAVKILDTRKVRMESIQKECHILEVLQNRNIIGVRGHGAGYNGKHKDHYFIFMELAGGGELFDQVIDRGADAMPEDYARNFFCQMLDGVNYCHLAGVAHRDLKLENVLLNAEGVIKLIDFGLSHVYPVDRSTGVTVVDRSKPLRDVCGSKSYAAPEVLAARGYDGFAADMWSLGVCLFAMLSGFFPLDEASAQDWRFPKLLEAQRTGRSTTAAVYGFYSRTPKHLSKHVVDLLDRLLQIDPARRMTMAEVRDHPWVTGVKPAEPNDQGSYNTHDMVGEDDEPVYRGMGALPSEFEADAMVDDDAPVYRSLGFSEPPPAPGLARQKGNADLTQRAPDVWGSLDLD